MVTGGPGKAPYDKLKTTFVDVAFLPGAGDTSLVDAEFFKHCRARYYVATTVAPTSDLLKALTVGKEAWNGMSCWCAIIEHVHFVPNATPKLPY